MSLCLFVPTKKPQILGNGVVERQNGEDLAVLLFLPSCACEKPSLFL
jgi:hypothetical protein